MIKARLGEGARLEWLPLEAIINSGALAGELKPCAPRIWRC